MLEKVKNWIRNRGEPLYENNLTSTSVELSTAYSYTPESCEKRIEWDPIANALTIRVAQLVTKNPPIFLDEQGNELEQIREDWVKNDYDSIFQETITATRAHGFCATEKLSKPFAGKNFLVHDPIDIVHINPDDRWNIQSYTVRPRIEETKRMVNYSIPEQRNVLARNCLHYQIGRKKYNQEGLSVLKPIWNLMVRANEILEAMAEYDSRVGHGYKWVMVDKNYYQGDIGKLKAEIKKWNWRRWIILFGNEESKPELHIDGATASAPNFQSDLETMLGYISAKSGFPIRWFIGSPKGAISAAKEDKRAVYDNLKSIFAEYKDWIRGFIELFYKNGETISDKIAEIEWDDEGVLEEIENQLGGNTEEMEEQVKYMANEKQKENEGN